MENLIIQPIHKGQMTMEEEYKKMLMDIKISPLKIANYSDLFEKILMDFNLDFCVVMDNFYFVFAEQTSITDFGIITLEVKQIYTLDGENCEMELLIISKHAKPKVARLNLLELNSSLWLDKLGVNYWFYGDFCAKKLKPAIKKMARYAPVVEEWLYEGWAVNKSGTYIMRGEKLHRDDIINENDRKLACSHTLKMLDVAEHRLTMPLLAMVILSLVHSRMILLGEFFKGAVALLAQSLSGKTTLMSLFFNFENGRTADINFDSTEAAMTRIIGGKRDSVCIVDDLKPASTAQMKKILLSKIEKIIRMCADDSNGYQRAGGRNSTVSNRAHGLVGITAEEIPVNVYSTLARLLVLVMDRKSMDMKQHSYFLNSHDIYRTFIKNYIRYIATQGVDNYCANLKQRFLDERDALRDKLLARNILIDPRTNDMAVWLYISFLEFLKYALTVEAIDHVQLEALSKDSEEIFLSIMTEQAERINELDDVTRFFKALHVLLDTKEATLVTLQARNDNFSAPESKTAIGFKKKGFIYLKNDVAYQCVSAYYRRNGKEFVIAESTLRRLLHDNGHILPKNPKSSIHRLYVNQESYQCIKFTDASFYKLKGGKSDGTESDREIPDNRGERENANLYLGRGN